MQNLDFVFSDPKKQKATEKLKSNLVMSPKIIKK